jgi:hypothetical protein
LHPAVVFPNECVSAAAAGIGCSNHLSIVVNVVGPAVCSTKRAEILHPSTVFPEKCMHRCIGSPGVSNNLAAIIDPMRHAGGTAERTEVGDDERHRMNATDIKERREKKTQYYGMAVGHQITL